MTAFATQSALRGALKMTAFDHAWAFYRKDLTPDRIEREYAAIFHLACRLRRAEEAEAAPGQRVAISGRWFCYCWLARKQRVDAFWLIGVDPAPSLPDDLVKLPPAL